MPHMNNQPSRKNLRIKHYDYSGAGCYFITICVKDNQEVLSRIDVGANCVRPTLSNYGEIVDKEIQTLSTIYEQINIDHYVIMPNHIHMLILIEASGRTQFAPTVSRVVKQFKGSVTKQIGHSIWQKSFHDHVVRNEEDYLSIWKYIDENPAKWAEDCYYKSNPTID